MPRKVVIMAVPFRGLFTSCRGSTRYVGLCELLLTVSASDSGIARSRYLNKSCCPSRFSAITLLSLAFWPSVWILYKNHNRDGRPAHHELFMFYEGGLVLNKLWAILRISIVTYIFSLVYIKLSACFYFI